MSRSTAYQGKQTKKNFFFIRSVSFAQRHEPLITLERHFIYAYLFEVETIVQKELLSTRDAIMFITQ
ncbi:hypothetical protein EHQ05_14685 [Leptospira yasudae]|uniref:hypothetical protein n=1 Tax=Leptospira yasudae TaxID=2202201 RepID=UPI001084238E|nr:hypothetical protein [Leptospira yasudae]TGK24177.1 hypothetical protein EHQ05_14685 [Leptospira yasudae]TGM00789.1 hypothetical protein EHQ86_19590 [Leptospira yasudae]